MAHAIAVTMRDLCPALQKKTYFNYDALLISQDQNSCSAVDLKQRRKKL